ncbi:MAG TPA: O-methyltransferase [Aggregatilineales bacterium]|nr:O-methyltransferase [Aggregatilineales bacterium]
MEQIDVGARETYIRELFAQEDDLLREAREEAAEQGLPAIHIQPEEARMLQFLLKAVGARRVLEIGALFGYSGVWLARALPEGGRLFTLEKDAERARLVRETFRRADISDRAEVRVGQAPGGLEALASEGPFCAIFIDADKAGYPEYLDWALENVRMGGLVLAHNAFQRGRVLDPDQTEAAVEGVRAFNRRLAEDPQLFGTIIPIGDGIAAAVRVG